MLGKVKTFIKNCVKEVIAEQQQQQTKDTKPKLKHRDFGADISSMELKQKNAKELLGLSFQKTIKDFKATKLVTAQDGKTTVAEDTAATYKDMAFPEIQPGTAKDIVFTFFSKFGFIGWQLCAVLSQHWLISNACSIPAKDAIRNGWQNTFADKDKEDENEDKEKEQKFLNELNEITNTKFKLSAKAIQWITKYNIFGIGIALPIIDGMDLEAPYNPDGIKKGAFKGIAIIDPYWIVPDFDQDVMNNPTNPDFYEPTHYRVMQGGKFQRIHKSHFIIAKRKEVPDILKPTYYFGGVPLTQEIYERVYAAEKSANEQPLLLLTKRLNCWKIDLEQFFADPEKYADRIKNFTDYRDNQGILLIDHEDDVSQLDTALSDLDQVVMSQYKLVAAVARIPVDKLFELTPSGALSNSGDFNIKNYNQDLNTMQNDLFKPFIDRINEIVMRSYYGKKDAISIVFNPTDNPTASELAESVKTETDTMQGLISTGVITTEEARQKLIADKRNGFSFLDEEAPEQEQDNAEIEQMMAEMKAGNGQNNNNNNGGQQNIPPKQQMPQKQSIPQTQAKDEEEPEYWFSTKTGAHIPVYKGQTPEEAIKKTFENKNNKTKTVKTKIDDFIYSSNGSKRTKSIVKEELKNFLPDHLIYSTGEAMERWLYALQYPSSKEIESITEIEIPEKFNNVDDLISFIDSIDEPMKKRYSDWEKDKERMKKTFKEESETLAKLKQKFENSPKGENIDSEGNKIKNPEQFKKWFGNSKAVDRNGNPIVLYHGSKHQLENGQFDFKHKGNSQNKQKAFFSTTREDVAQTYVGNEGKLHKIFIKMEKPLIVDFKHNDFRTGGYEQFAVIPYGEDPDTYPTIIERKSRFADSSEAPVISKIINYAKKNGYDGVIAKNIDDFENHKHTSVTEYNDDYIVFNPKEQIKSVDNDGQWSGKTIYDEAIFAEDTEWITVHPHGNKDHKGQPVPVEEGQGKGEAIKQHFARAAAGETHMYNDNDDDDDLDFSFNPEVIEEQEELEKRDKELAKEHKKEAAKAKREQKKWNKMSEEEKEAERNEWYEAETKREKQAKKENPQKTLPEAKRELEELGITGMRKPSKEGYGKERWEEYNALSPRIKRAFFPDRTDDNTALKWDEANKILEDNEHIKEKDIFEYLRVIDIKTPLSRTNERTRNYLKGEQAEDKKEWDENKVNRTAEGKFAPKGTKERKPVILGVEFKGYKDKPEEAIEKLIKEKQGNIKDALSRKELGYIMLLWGENDPKTNKGYGLKHIIEKRTTADKINGEDFARKIPDIVKNGTITEILPEKIHIEKDNNRVVIKTTIDDDKINWVVSEFILYEK